MITLSRLVALACVAQLMIGLSLLGHAATPKPVVGSSSSVVAEELNKARLTPKEVFELLNKQKPRNEKLFKSYSAQDFVDFADFEAKDCTKDGIGKRETFIQELEKVGNSSNLSKNLMKFCLDLHADLVSFCKKVNPKM